METMQGLILGVVTTAGLWLFARTFLGARVLFSSGVSVVQSPNTPTAERLRYRVKAKNVSLYRGVADVRFTATLVVHGLNPNGGSWSRIRLETSTEGAAALDAGRNRLMTLRFRELTEFMRTNVADYGHADLAELRDQDIAVLMRTLADAGKAPHEGRTSPYIEVTALVTESWTGKQYVARSPLYRLADLIPGPFTTETSRQRELAATIRKRLRRVRDAFRRWRLSHHGDLHVRRSAQEPL